MITKYIKLLH